GAPRNRPLRGRESPDDRVYLQRGAKDRRALLPAPSADWQSPPLRVGTRIHAREGLQRARDVERPSDQHAVHAKVSRRVHGVDAVERTPSRYASATIIHGGKLVAPDGSS